MTYKFTYVHWMICYPSIPRDRTWETYNADDERNNCKTVNNGMTGSIDIFPSNYIYTCLYTSTT